jgi:hypothetical protein
MVPMTKIPFTVEKKVTLLYKEIISIIYLYLFEGLHRSRRNPQL